MFKRILLAAILGVGSLGIAQMALLSSSTADLEGPDAPISEQRVGQAPQANAAEPQHQDSDPAAEANASCYANVEEDNGAVEAAQACFLSAAVASDDNLRSKALRRAADMLRSQDGAAADSALMLAAGAGDTTSLVIYGSVTSRDPAEALTRREALLAAEGQGDPQVAEALRLFRSHFEAQALSRPDTIIALVEGRGDTLGTGVEDDRYLVGLAEALVRSCPWQGPMWDGVGFRKSLELFAAPLRSSAQARLVNDIGASTGSVLSAAGRLAARMWDGQPYSEAGTEFLREVRSAHRHLSVAASRGSESGARDGVRIAELQGCASADGLRLARGLRGVFERRVSMQTQGGTASK